MTWTRIGIVALGGALGAAARYVLAGAVMRVTGSTFPAGTLVVNLLGCLLVGVVAGAAIDRAGLVGPGLRLFLIIGVCGGFTTFSAFGYETLELLRTDQILRATLNVGGHVIAGLAAVWVGLVLARLV